MKQYPKQIICLHTKKNSFDIQAEMVAVDEESNDSPLEIHKSGLSRFILTIKDSAGFVNANIPTRDIGGILELSRVALNLKESRKMGESTGTDTLNRAVLNKLREKLSVGEAIDQADLNELEGKEEPTATTDMSSDVYTLAIPLCGRKTAAELIKTEGVSRAVNQEKFIRSKAGEDPRFTENNIRQADALKEAIRLYNDGLLDGSAPAPKEAKTYQVYFKGPKPRMSKKDKDGNVQIYNISIKCFLENDKYPWEIKIDSWYGKVTEQEDRSLRVGERASETVTKSIFLSDEDYARTLRCMDKTLDHFEQMVFAEMFNMSQKYAWKPGDKTE